MSSLFTGADLHELLILKLINFQDQEEKIMEFNVAKERLKFFEEQDRLAREYRKAGMTEEQIKVMFDYDYEAFKKERVFCEHNIPLTQKGFGGKDTQMDESDMVYLNMEKFVAKTDTYNPADRYGWVEKVENPKLYEALKSLSEKEVELLALHFKEGYTQTEIAKIRGVSQQSLAKKIRKLKDFLKKFS